MERAKVTPLLEVEARAWPFVITVLPATLSEDFTTRYFAKQAEFLQRAQPWVHLVDIRPLCRIPDARIRALIGEHTKRLEHLSARYNRGTALVLESPLARGVLTAIHWISPPTYRFASVATPAEGVEYLRTELRESGIPIPSEMGVSLVEQVAQRVHQSQHKSQAETR